MGVYIGSTDLSNALVGATGVNAIYIGDEEVWTGKYYIVKNGVIIDTSILDTASKGNIVSGTFGVSGDTGVTTIGTIISNTLTNLTLRSTNEDSSDNTYRGCVLAKLSYFGFVPPTEYTKFVIKGTYSNVNTFDSGIRGSYSAFSYADVNNANWVGSTMKTNEKKIYDGAFEEIIDISNMSQVFVEWVLYGARSTTQFDISLKITDMYFE